MRCPCAFLTVFAAMTSVPPAHSGANVLCNSSFNVGLQGWSCYTRGTGGYPNDIRLASSDPWPEWAAGLLQYHAPADSSFVVASRAHEVAAGMYELRASLIAEMECVVQLVDSGKPRENVVTEIAVAPDAQWQQIAAQVVVEAGQVAIVVRGQGPGLLELDDIELNGNADPAMPAEVGLAAVEQDSVFMLGSDVGFEARLYVASALTGALAYRVENAWGDVIAEGSQPIEAPAGELVRTVLKPQIAQTGHYRILAQATTDAGPASLPSEALFAVIPHRELATSTADADRSRFGCNMTNRPQLIGIAQKLGMRWVFCAPPLFTKWFSAEPRPGEWITYDDVVADFEAAGLRIVGNLADPPYWATRPGDKRYSGPWPNATVPTDWSRWESYVTRIVDHYHPRITHWALWNEPNHPGYLKLTEGQEWVSRYVELLEHTYSHVKAVDPGMQVVGGTVTNPGALPPLVVGGGLPLMDVAAFHWSSWSPDGYVRATGEELGLLGPADKWVNCVKRITEAYATAGASAPLWDTECHLTEADIERAFATQPAVPQQYNTPVMTALDAAAAVPRQHIAEWAAGVERTFAWLLSVSSGPWQPRTAITMLEWDRSPAAALVTYAVMTDMFDDAELVGWETRTDTSQLDRPTFWTFTFRKPSGTLRVIWGNRDAEHEVMLDTGGGDVMVHDMFGVERPGAGSMSGVDLTNKVALRVGRHPYYILEVD